MSDRRTTDPSGPAPQAGTRRPGWPWVEPWYAAYALLGAAMAGVAPILLPLEVGRSGSAADIGFVMAAFNLGGLSAPLWGLLADRFRLHRLLLSGGLLVAAAGLVGFAAVSGLGGRIALAGLQAVGAAAAATVATLLVVEAHARAEWDARIGWLQSFYGAGQVGGLLLAGVLATQDSQRGLIVAAAVVVVGSLAGLATARTPPALAGERPSLAHHPGRAEWPGWSPHRLYHLARPDALRSIGAVVGSPFSRFLLGWLLSFAGTAILFSLYPVYMRAAFGISPGLSATTFAVAAGLGLLLYAPAGGWSQRGGPEVVLRAGLGGRLVAVALLLVLGVGSPTGAAWLALLSWVVVVLCWSLLSVAGTALAARVAPVGEGEAMGLFNATTAVAGVVGAAVGGWVAQTWGYQALPAASVLAIASGLAAMAGLTARGART